MNTTLVITPDSHLDHGLTAAHLAFILKAFSAPSETGVAIVTLELPEELEGLSCALYGPACGDSPVPEDEVVYRARGDRSYNSRMVARAPRSVRQVTVIAGPHKDLPCVLYTAFGGPASPREPADPFLAKTGRQESEAFWAEHALASG